MEKKQAVYKIIIADKEFGKRHKLFIYIYRFWFTILTPQGGGGRRRFVGFSEGFQSDPRYSSGREELRGEA